MVKLVISRYQHLINTIEKDIFHWLNDIVIELAKQEKELLDIISNYETSVAEKDALIKSLLTENDILNRIRQDNIKTGE